MLVDFQLSLLVFGAHRMTIIVCYLQPVQRLFYFLYNYPIQIIR